VLRKLLPEPLKIMLASFVRSWRGK
jgi:hypothetical protein